MAIPIKMPQPGNTVEECILVNWTVKQGDRVSAGEVIAEIETDKANFDIEAPTDGTLLATFFEAGALIPVLTNICVVGESGEDVEPYRPAAPAPPPREKISAISKERPAATSAPVQRAAATAGEPAVAPGMVAAPKEPSAGVLSPRARRFAADHDFHPPNPAGSGPGGRVVEADLRALHDNSPRISSLAKSMLEAGYRIRGEGSGINRMLLAQDLTDPPVRVSRLRATIARRMRESLAETAQYTMHSSAVAAGLLAAREKIKSGGNASNANINDLVMFCVVKTLIEAPELNAEFIDGAIYRHQQINLAFACDTPRGLVVPVVKDCRSLPLDELAARIHELSDSAIAGNLGPDDMAGGTFTVSNLGSLGIEAFTPIVNPPQVAILGVNAIRLKPERVDGEVVFVDRIGLSVTCDHQVIDGAPGARFLQKLSRNIENVEALSGLTA